MANPFGGFSLIISFSSLSSFKTLHLNFTQRCTPLNVSHKRARYQWSSTFKGVPHTASLNTAKKARGWGPWARKPTRVATSWRPAKSTRWAQRVPSPGYKQRERERDARM